MGLFDKFKKKNANAPVATTKEVTTTPEEYLDDITFIQEMKHIAAVPWHQYDILLAAQGYGWETMVDWADYMCDAELEGVSEVIVGELGGATDNISAQFKNNGNKLKGLAEIDTERGSLSVAGMSQTLRAPMKIVWINQTRVLRLFTWVNDETLIKKYVETVVRRTFKTENAMKLGKPIPEKQ